MNEKRVVITGYSSVIPKSSEETYGDALGNRKLKRLARRSGLLLMKAAKDAMDMAELDADSLPSDKTSIFVAEYMRQKPDIEIVLEILSGCIDEEELAGFDDGLYAKFAAKHWRTLQVLSYLPNIPGFLVALSVQSKGYLATELSTCAGGLLSVAEGYEKIKSGEMEIALVGGTSSKTIPFEKVKYETLGFFTDDDYMMAEGAGMLVLESEESAKKRNRPILAEVIGSGMSFSPKTYRDKVFDEEGVSIAIKQAIDRANLNKDVKLDYYPGSFTKRFSREEEELLGELPFDFDVNNSAKESVGYTFAASGIIELINAMENINRTNTDDGLNSVFSIVNTFGMGGQNASIIVQGGRK